jgi:2-keto-4-pentenoate hydratase
MSIDRKTIDAVAERLRKAAETGVAVAPIRDEIAAGGVAAAYAVQQANTDFYLKQGRRLVGRKIGLTSKSVQKQLGVDSPDFGMLYADMALYDGETPLGASCSRRSRRSGVVLERDIDRPGDARGARVGHRLRLLAIEIVGSRIEKWNIKLLDTIADNASSGLFVLGAEPRKLVGLDLRLCGMVMERRGEPESVGAGAACLGNPLNAALWLARTMVELGNPLKAGDVIMSGALGPMVGVAPGDVIDTRINGLGSVRAVFAA